jgi:hypothetical protein
MESSNAMLVLLVAVVCSCTEAADSIRGRGFDSARLPQNVAVLAGDDVTFTCWADSNTTSRVLWYEFAYALGGAIISDGALCSPSHPQAARYSIVHERPEQYDLMIHNVTLNDGGMYMCQDVNSMPPAVFRGYAELVVIGGDQQCLTSLPNNDSNQVVVEGTTFISDCSINYKGNLRPYMHWHGPQPFDQVKANTSTASYSAMLAVVDRSMDQGSWRSVVNFTAPLTPPAADAATNVPDFTMTYATPTVSVRLTGGPRNPLNLAVREGEDAIFTCWKDPRGHPESVIQWVEYIYGSIPKEGMLISDGTTVEAHPQRARYSIVHDHPDQFDLMIRNVTMADGGKYACFVRNDTGSSKLRLSAELVVTGGEPRCTTTIPSDGSNIAVVEGQSCSTECIVDYRGNFVPYMRWYGPEPFAQVQSNISTMSYSAMQVYVDRSMDQGSWRLVVNFTAPRTPPAADAAANVPDFTMTYATPTITVRSSNSSSSTAQTTPSTTMPSTASSSTATPSTASSSTTNPSTTASQPTTKPATDESSTGATQLMTTRP